MGNGAKNHMDCPEVQDAIEVIRAAAENAGKLSGIFCISAEQAAARFAQGFQFINIGGDSESIDSLTSDKHTFANVHPDLQISRRYFELE